MTPERMNPEFEKWWNGLENAHTVASSIVAELAWLEATRQAYEDSANIVIDSPSYFTSKDRVGLAQVIRQRLKEYDNGN